MKKLYAFCLALVALTFLNLGPAFAQGTQLGDGSTFTGHAAVAGTPPVGTGCTITAGSTDMAGACTATAASGTIVFSKAFASPPFCVVSDNSATPVAVYAMITTQITLTTITSGHLYSWICFGRSGN